MKNIIFALLLLAQIWPTQASAQNCVDSTLINPTALCPMIWLPVCGCDGVTYANDCEAVNYGGVTSFTQGECVAVGCPSVGGIDFGLCDMFLGYAWTGTNCTGVSGCGYVVEEIDYSPYFYANIDDCAAQCGGGDCISQQQLDQGALVDCSDQYMPVCGCDGITYANECHGYFYGGNTLLSNGPCDGQQPYCPRIPSSVSFGDCDMVLGWGFTTQGCISISGCDYLGNNGYDYSSFFYASSYECNNQCIGSVVIECVDSTQIDISIQCPAIWDPVCGCDSVTYSNSCVAMYHNGVMSYTPGECLVGISDLIIEENQLNLYPNPATDRIQVSIDNFRPGTIVIYDLSGKMVLEPISIKTNNQVVQLNGLTNGLYIVEWNSKDNPGVRTRLIKSNR